MLGSPALAVLLTATVVALLLATLAGPVAAASGKYGGGRMVIIHAPGAKVVGASGARAATRWHYRRVEDEVAPEYGTLLATNSNGGGRISSGALDKNRPGCLSSSQCAGKAGGAYTRLCTFKNQCPH